MKFEIVACKAEDTRTFYYDNTTNTISNSLGEVFEYPNGQRFHGIKKSLKFSKDAPLKKSKDINVLKIQLGLSCNYSCDYCSQKFVERAPETSKKDIEGFMKKLENLNFKEEDGLKIEFWGGEPLVYWKTLKPLAEELMKKFSSWKVKPSFSIITNGSLLTEEICIWLYLNEFQIGISHDGPAQSVRGPDPFDDPIKRKTILDFYKIMKSVNRISFNTMMSKSNISRKAVYEWFVNLTGDKDIVIGEGTIVDAYDVDGSNNSLNTLEEHFNYRRTSFNDIYEGDGDINFFVVLQKIDNFTNSVLSHIGTEWVGQKCGMDSENSIAVDLTGSVITCQNVSNVETSHNGQPHLVGSITDIENVAIKTSTHWSNREHCSACPVLHICKGSCMFLDGEFWDVSCKNSYSDNIPLFALAFEKITNGYIPVTIKGDGLPLDRQDIWGTVYEHKEVKKNKIIPIKVVSVKDVTVIDGINIYDHSLIKA